jgi:hypothetical protein
MPVSRACRSAIFLSRDSCRVITSSRVAGCLLTHCIQVPVSSVHSRGGSIAFTMSSSCVVAALAPRLLLLLAGCVGCCDGSSPSKIGWSYLSRLSGTVLGYCILSAACEPCAKHAKSNGFDVTDILTVTALLCCACAASASRHLYANQHCLVVHARSPQVAAYKDITMTYTRKRVQMTALAPTAHCRAPVTTLDSTERCLQWLFVQQSELHDLHERHIKVTHALRSVLSSASCIRRCSKAANLQHARTDAVQVKLMQN